MDSHITVHLDYHVPQRCMLLLQIRAMTDSQQMVTWENMEISPQLTFRDMPADEGIGNRIWLETEEQLTVSYAAQVTVNRRAADLKRLPETPLHMLPPQIVKYLMPSRYCGSSSFGDFMPDAFGDLRGGARVKAMSDWIMQNLAYDNGASNAYTTAEDTFAGRRGVCRDFAHLLIAMCRSSAIPARIASVYAPDVTPPDFHAVTEVYLGGAWHLIDPTGMTTPERMIMLGVGRDAADVAFLTAFGVALLNQQSVSVTVTGE